MKTVYKYPLEITDEQTINLPKDALIISAMEVRGQLCLYAAVDTDNELEERTILICGTGNPASGGLVSYIDSVKMCNDALVFHIFEKFWD